MIKTSNTWRSIEIRDKETAIFRVGSQEVIAYVADGELRIYADNMIHITPWSTNTIRVRVEESR